MLFEPSSLYKVLLLELKGCKIRFYRFFHAEKLVPPLKIIAAYILNMA